MHPPSPAQGLRQKAAIGAVETMEETMRILTINELLRLTRTELYSLLAAAEHILRRPDASAPERTGAQANIAAIRLALLRRRSGPAP